jgi:hypothetical protein
MSIEEKNELMTALLTVMPSAEIRHLSTLIKAAEGRVEGLHIPEVIALLRAGAIKIKL